MANKIKICNKCRVYTINESHCGEATKTAHPPKFSLSDKYAKYRMLAKRS